MLLTQNEMTVIQSTQELLYLENNIVNALPEISFQYIQQNRRKKLHVLQPSSQEIVTGTVYGVSKGI